MRHLCKSCAGLSIDDDTIDDIQALSRLQQTRHTLDNWNLVDVRALNASAKGLVDKKPCHLCALILRSLKDHRMIGTAREESSLLAGAISLVLRTTAENLELVAVADDYEGYPLTISTGFDESSRGQDVSTRPDSDEVISLIKQWCQDCRSKHKNCFGAEKHESWLPDRVIDVGPSDGSQEPYLKSSAGHSGKYVALTHRWMLNERSCTTSMNFEARKKAISTVELSPAFRDAIYLTRMLDLRYLWIDAICIIQDRLDDWDRQSSNMMSIYEFCWLNISIAGSEIESGFFLKRETRLNRPCRLPPAMSPLTIALDPSSDISDQDIYVYLGSEFYAKSVYEGFISRRAWMYQERILSPRTLYFGREQIYWECTMFAASETCPWGFLNQSAWPLVKMRSPNGPPNAMIRDYSSSSYSPMHQSSNSFQEGTFDYWYKLVAIYSTLELTKQTDTLRAILGLAQALHKSHQGGTFSDEYLHGLWLRDIYKCISWCPAFAQSNGTMPVSGLPTYSWASYQGAIRINENWLWSLSRYYTHVELYSNWKSTFWTNLSYKDVGIVAWGAESRPGLQMWGSLQVGTLNELKDKRQNGLNEKGAGRKENGDWDLDEIDSDLGEGYWLKQFEYLKQEKRDLEKRQQNLAVRIRTLNSQHQAYLKEKENPRRADRISKRELLPGNIRKVENMIGSSKNRRVANPSLQPDLVPTGATVRLLGNGLLLIPIMKSEKVQHIMADSRWAAIDAHPPFERIGVQSFSKTYINSNLGRLDCIVVL